MTATGFKASWVEANQTFLVAQFARMKRRLACEPEDSASPLEEVQAGLDSAPAIDRLCEIFGLSGFEREILLLSAGVEMDSELAARCGTAQGHPQRTYATFGLAMAALSEPHWSALTPARPLRHFRLVELEPGHGLTSAPLRIDERILHYLAGVNLLDQRLQPILHLSQSPDWIAEDHRLLAAQAAPLFESRSLEPPVLHLCGDDPQGQEDTATLAAQENGQQLFMVRGEELPGPGPDLDQFITLWEREALLLPGALLIQCFHSGVTVSARRVLERLSVPVAAASREPARLDRPCHRFDVNKPGPAEQRRLWEKGLGPAASTLNGALDALSEQFRLSAKTIYSASTSCEDASTPGHLWTLCRSLALPRLEDLAQRIVPCAGWDDLVLPDLQMQMLRQLATQVHHRLKVYETWGFAAKGRRGLGVSALFAGESGTGKTMAAEVLARELALDLYRIDLSAVVSKYIGETEKNLKQVFDAAEEGGVLLLFDEADALFGKRSEVRDSHDRYANIEVGYLLQRMEGYQGLAILTTNSKSALDKSFLRRLRFTVNFPFPDAAQREAIWKRIFPAKTPSQGLNNSRLAQLNVAGGNIRNIALNAAFLAAESKAPVQMVHVLKAARLEAQKIERALSEAEIRGWV
jgi:hypothetical protein